MSRLQYSILLSVRNTFIFLPDLCQKINLSISRRIVYEREEIFRSSNRFHLDIGLQISEQINSLDSFPLSFVELKENRCNLPIKHA